MKKLLAACAMMVWCVYLVVSIPVMAQTQSSTEVQGADKAQKISQALNLGPQEQSQLTPIMEDEERKVQDIKNDTALSSGEKQARIKKVYGQTDKLVKPILNPAQWKQWEQYRKNELSNIK